jgi:hypothetical protein
MGLLQTSGLPLFSEDERQQSIPTLQECNLTWLTIHFLWNAKIHSQASDLPVVKAGTVPEVQHSLLNK